MVEAKGAFLLGTAYENASKGERTPVHEIMESLVHQDVA